MVPDMGFGHRHLGKAIVFLRPQVAFPNKFTSCCVKSIHLIRNPGRANINFSSLKAGVAYQASPAGNFHFNIPFKEPD